MTKQLAGFTLIELIVAIAVLAILIALAAPNFRATIDSNRLATTSNNLIATLQFARSEAVRRNQRVEVCPTSDPSDPTAECSSSTSGWELGWMVLDPDPCPAGDDNGDGDGDDPVDACDRRLRIGGAVRGLTGAADPKLCSTHVEIWILGRQLKSILLLTTPARPAGYACWQMVARLLFGLVKIRPASKFELMPKSWIFSLS